MSVIIVTPPAEEPVTLAQAREHCRADPGGADDATLALCIAAARANCEQRIGRPIIARGVEQTFPAFGDLPLSLPEPLTVTAVRYTDDTGVARTLASSVYTTTDDGDRATVTRAASQQWPAVQAGSRVTVAYTAGLAEDADGVPADLHAWMLLTIGYLFQQRELFDTSGRVADIPNRFTDTLLDGFRRRVFA